MSDFIADDRGMHELWEKIKNMSDEEFERHIAELKKQEAENQK